MSSSSLRNSRLSSSCVSEAESEWRGETTIVRNPLPVILEGKEVELKFSDIRESDYEESEFGADDIESDSIVKVNLAVIHVK